MIVFNNNNGNLIDSFSFGGKTYTTIQVVKIRNGQTFSSVPEVCLDKVISTYKLERETISLALMIGSRITLAKTHVLANGKIHDLGLTLCLTKIGNKVCCEVLMDVFFPEEDGGYWMDFKQVDRFNILL